MVIDLVQLGYSLLARCSRIYSSSPDFGPFVRHVCPRRVRFAHPSPLRLLPSYTSHRDTEAPPLRCSNGSVRYLAQPQGTFLPCGLRVTQLIRPASKRPTNAEAGPLRLPLELILHILDLALPPPTMSPPNINPRLRYLLRLMRVCLVLQEWAEDRLYEGMITPQRSEGLWKMVGCLKNAVEKAGRVRHLVLLLEESESTRRRQPRQNKAIAALLEVCTRVQVLRLQCPHSYRSAVELESIAKLQGEVEARGRRPMSAELLGRVTDGYRTLRSPK